MELVVHPHALKHGVTEDQIVYAWEHFVRMQNRTTPNEDVVLAVGYERGGEDAANGRAASRWVRAHISRNDATNHKGSGRAWIAEEVAMQSAKEIEARFGISEAEVQAAAEPWERGDVVGEASGPIRIGRPLKFGESLQFVGFKLPAQQAEAMDLRASSLGLSRSDYLRQLVYADLANEAL